MKVLVVSSATIDWLYHGAQRVILGTLGSLILAGYNVVYLCVGPSNENTEMASHGVVTCKSGNSIVNISYRRCLDHWQHRPLPSSVLAEYVKEEDPDIILVSSDKLAPSMKILSKKVGAPMILQLHIIRGMWLKEYFRRFGNLEMLKAPFSVAHKLAISYLSDYIITLSCIEENFLRKFGYRRLRTVPPTYFTVEDKPLNNGIRPISTEEPYVLTVGPAALNTPAILRLANELRNMNFVIAGASPKHFDSVFKKEGLPIPSNLRIVGRVSDPVLSKLYTNATLVFMPLEFAGGASVRLVEALAHGRAVIAPRHRAAAFKGLVEGRHIQIYDDTLTLMSKVRKLMGSNALRMSLEELARKYYASTLSPRVHARQLEEAFSQAMRLATL